MYGSRRHWPIKIWGMRRQRFYTNSDCATLQGYIIKNEICELIYFLHVYRYVFAFLTKMTSIIASIFRVECPYNFRTC